MIELREFLLATLASGAAVGGFIFLLFEYFDIAATMPIKWKRVFIAIISGLSGTALWAFTVWLGYLTQPETNQAIAEAIWMYGVGTGFSAFTTATLVHGFAKKPSEKDVLTDLLNRDL
jgi:hypothetical protein